MSLVRARLVDLDGSVAAQPQMRAALETGGDLVAARDLAPRLRFLADRRALDALDARLGPPRAGEVFFYGSGDFHHLAYLFVARLDRPVSVVHFDNHPDWTSFPRTLGCGSWVSRLLARGDIARVVTIGPCSSDIEAPQLKQADLPAMRSGRLEVHPLATAATFYAGPAFESPGARGATGEGLLWRGLEAGEWAAEIAAIAARLPDAPLWITLDKDVLRQDEAITNWDQGRLDLDRVLEAIGIFAAHRPLLGMDVCGDFSPEGRIGPLRQFLAFLDKSQRPHPTGDAAAVNGAANGRILKHMEALLP